MELAPPTEMSERPTLAFMIEETVHDESLPDAPPGVQLVLPTGERASPYLALVKATDPHHRTTRLLFADARAAPIDPMAPDAQGSVILVVPFADGTVSAGNTFEWRLPIDLTPDATFNSPGASG